MALKLTQADRERIVKLYNNGLQPRIIETEFPGVPKSTISNVISRARAKGSIDQPPCLPGVVRRSNDYFLKVPLALDARTELKEQAKALGINRLRLANKILTAVLLEQRVQTVLEGWL